MLSIVVTGCIAWRIAIVGDVKSDSRYVVCVVHGLCPPNWILDNSNLEGPHHLHSIPTKFRKNILIGGRDMPPKLNSKRARWRRNSAIGSSCDNCHPSGTFLRIIVLNFKKIARLSYCKIPISLLMSVQLFLCILLNIHCQWHSAVVQALYKDVMLLEWTIDTVHYACVLHVSVNWFLSISGLIQSGLSGLLVSHGLPCVVNSTTAGWGGEGVSCDNEVVTDSAWYGPAGRHLTVSTASIHHLVGRQWFLQVLCVLFRPPTQFLSLSHRSGVTASLQWWPPTGIMVWADAE